MSKDQKEDPKDSETIEELQAKLEKLTAEKQQIAEKYSALEKEAIASGKVPVPIKGTFKVGKETYGFKKGSVKVRNLKGKELPTETLIQIANKSDFTPSDKEMKAYPALKGIDQAKAKEFLAWLVQIKYGRLQKRT